jgi:hypothetical protein
MSRHQKLKILTSRQNQIKPTLMKKNFTFYFFIAAVVCSMAQNGPHLRRIEGQGNDGLVLDFIPGMHDSILNSSNGLYKYPVYDNNAGPVWIDIYNPLLTPAGNFIIEFNDTTSNLAGNDICDPSTKWILINVPLNDTVFGDSVIGVDHIQDIATWGMKIRTRPTDDPGQSAYTANGFLQATMAFADPFQPWLGYLQDDDAMPSENWVRSGTYTNMFNQTHNDFAGIDDNQVYEGVLNGSWAPYRLAAQTDPVSGGPVVNVGMPAWEKYRALTLLKNIASVDIVFTSDKSKWTRCPVIELQHDAALALGGAKKMAIRRSPSVDKNGKKSGDSGYNSFEGGYIDSAGTLISAPTGMGWFPGYAINLETGERLNMAFGEDSYLTSENGSDMVWNPTSTKYSVNSDPVFGGMHYIYIFGHNGDARYSFVDPLLANQLKDIPAYDKGLTLYKLYKAIDMASSTTISEAYKREIYSDAMWVSMPLLNPGRTWLSTDVNIRLRVSKQYRQQDIDGSNTTNPKYTFNAGTISGLSDLANEEFFLLYPNPASEYLNIKSNKVLKDGTIAVYDINGRLQKTVVTDAVGKVNVSALSAGMYFLRYTDNDMIRVQRFVKQ